jgi:hypothetical protein
MISLWDWSYSGMNCWMFFIAVILVYYLVNQWMWSLRAYELIICVRRGYSLRKECFVYLFVGLLGLFEPKLNKFEWKQECLPQFTSESKEQKHKNTHFTIRLMFSEF